MLIIVIAVIIAMMTFALGRFGMRSGRQGRQHHDTRQCRDRNCQTHRHHLVDPPRT
jgi:hypothetical protein